MHSRRFHFVVTGTSVIIFGLGISPVSAWTAPTATPPGNNVSAPLNIGTANQVKNGNIGVNGIAVFGNTLLGGSAGSNAYLNFGATAGSSGYGIRDNAGTIEFKNSGGSWSSIQNTVYNLGGGLWTASGSNIYYNGGLVGIGIASPVVPLQVHLCSNSDIGFFNSTYATVGAFNDTFSAWNNLQIGPSMYETSGGNVGIGTTNPGGKLDVMNTASNGGNSNDGIVFGQLNGDNSNSIQTYIDGQWSNRTSYASGCCNTLYLNQDVGDVILANTLTARHAGNVGIGTVNPAQKLDVAGNVNTSGVYLTSGGAQFANNGDIYMPWKGQWLSSALSAGASQWATNGSYIYNTNGGSGVGIGTASPGYALDVNGAINSNNWTYSNELYTRDNIYLGYLGDYLSNRLNQVVTTNSQPHFGRVWDDDNTHFMDSNVQSYMSSILLDGSLTSTSGATFQYNGDVYMPWAGVWLSTYLTSGSYGNAARAVGGDNYFRINGGGNYFYDNGDWLHLAGNKFTSDGPMYAPAYYYTSDERLKKNIESIPSQTALDDVLALRPVTFNWKDVTLDQGKEQLGFIAQEVRKIVPDLVSENASTTMLSVDYGHITPLLVGSVQALDETIAGQQREIDEQREEIGELRARLDALDAKRAN